MRRRVVVVEDHGLIATTVAAALRRNGHEVHVIDANDPASLLERIRAHDPEVVLLDLDLGPGGDGLDLIAPLSRASSRVVVLTGDRDPARHGRCLAAGAVGVLAKDGGFDELVAGLERVRRGQDLLDAARRQELLTAARDAERRDEQRLAPFASLSRREQQVLGELMAGRTVDVIAREGHVSVATVRSQVKAIREKLGVSSQLSAVAVATEAGWRPPD
ncbi:MAG: response regulator transcription factor [Nitriliruptoraceae bacterium]|nr:response regulator transcription factor [Nitriliruptoraceae bacterium]